MTFQGIIERMIREDSEEWVMDLLFKSGNMLNVAAEEVRFKDITDGKMYFCDVEILNGFSLAVGKVEVSGSITYHGVKHAQIKRDGKTIWHESRFIREDMGITEFKI